MQEKLGKIKIRSLKNISGENVSGRIKLEYSYKTEYVSFTIMREEEEGHYIITALTYEPDISNDFRTTTSNRITINNRGPNTITQSYCVENICRYMSDSKPRRSATSTSTPIRNFRWWRYRPISAQLKPRWSPENSTARKSATRRALLYQTPGQHLGQRSEFLGSLSGGDTAHVSRYKQYDYIENHNDGQRIAPHKQPHLRPKPRSADNGNRHPAILLYIQLENITPR